MKHPLIGTKIRKNKKENMTKIEKKQRRHPGASSKMQ